MRTLFANALRLFVAGLLCALSLVHAQEFTSGSNGSDGAFELTANDPRVVGGVFTWDPARDNLDLDGDNVYHFTTITLPANVTVRIRADKTRHPGPIIWLATGLVQIGGTVDLSGESGHAASLSNFAIRRPAVPGPGGYPGGVGVRFGSTPESGAGPGGGGAQTGQTWGCPASHAGQPVVTNGNFISACNTKLAEAYGNPLLQPLVGGSGGSGGSSASGNCFGGGGGAGGGAIRISSSNEIRFTNAAASVYVNGGGAVNAGITGCNPGGSGSGGAIHLQAPLISHPSGVNGNFGLRAFGNNNGTWASSEGRIRLDYTNLTAGTVIAPTPTTGPLVTIPLPAPPTLRIVSVNGSAAPALPVAGYTTPDVQVNTSGPVAITVQAQNVPANSVLRLRVSSEGESSVLDQEVPVTLNAQLQGTVNVTFPDGVSRFYIRAIW
jgi:hypothetical protein